MFGEAPFGAFLVRMRIFYFKLASFVAMEYNKYNELAYFCVILYY